jgi:hypothetical protein
LKRGFEEAHAIEYKDKLGKLETDKEWMKKLVEQEKKKGTLLIERLILDIATSSHGEMEVDSSSNTSHSSRSIINIQIDGIDINTEHLKRPDLLSKLTNLLDENRFVRLTSPAASGKSSLLMLYQHSLENTNVISISCLDKRSCNEMLLYWGIDFLKQTTTDKIRKKETVVFIDDAQAKYEDTEF